MANAKKVLNSVLEGRYVVVPVDTDTSNPYLQVQHWPDEEHLMTRTFIANVPYQYGNHESYKEAMENANVIAAGQTMKTALDKIMSLAHKHEVQYWLNAPGTDEEKLGRILNIAREAFAAAQGN